MDLVFYVNYAVWFLFSAVCLLHFWILGLVFVSAKLHGLEGRGYTTTSRG